MRRELRGGRGALGALGGETALAHGRDARGCDRPSARVGVDDDSGDDNSGDEQHGGDARGAGLGTVVGMVGVAECADQRRSQYNDGNRQSGDASILEPTLHDGECTSSLARVSMGLCRAGLAGGAGLGEILIDSTGFRYIMRPCTNVRGNRIPR